MFEMGNVLILVRKELRDAARNRWFLLYSIAFTILSLALAGLGLSAAGSSGLAGFGRTAASMVNLVLLIVPLMGLTIGAMSLASERERGSLLYLLAQPITHLELLLGKFLGLATALFFSLFIGFGLSGVLIVIANGVAQIGVYLNLLFFAFLLALVSLSIGFLISMSARKASSAIGISVFLWLILVFIGDLGLMGTAIVMEFKIGTLFILALLNPLQNFKMAALLNIRNSLEVMGPAGIYAVRTYGAGLLPILSTVLVIWVIAPLWVTQRMFRSRGGL
jgi:Cu-processing system permease protein